MFTRIALGGALVAVGAATAAAAPCDTSAATFVVDGITCQLSGVYEFDEVRIINGGVVEVPAYAGGDKTLTGNLELRAPLILVDATSRITARGRGYQTPICGDGQGPWIATGTGDALTKAGTTMTLTDAAGLFLPIHVGRPITINGATTAANRGVYTITAVVSATEVQFTNAAGVAEAFAGTWIVDGIGGQGGCAVRDSGGGGGHFGGGGRGTRDISGTQSFPRDFEEDCGNTVVYDGLGVPSCSDTANCRGGSDGLPSVAGTAFFHSIYEPEFGASGGDKGCRDGDGTTVNTAGGGGGRIVLAAVGGTVTVDGTLDARGRRGCGDGNDSAGGGAGGTLFVAGDQVNVGATARFDAAGGLGGDTSGATDPTGECVGAPYQQSGTCDDCGGGGGGGIISVLSVTYAIDDEAVFDVKGAVGGTCTICQGEAGGGAGEIQISGGYVGEFCDGFDNDFDDDVDEDLGDLDCAGVSQPACVGGVPQTCPPDVPACIGPVTDARARFAVIVDTSGSMLLTLGGVPTFGDGSLEHPGRDQDGLGGADDSRLFKAKNALTTVISAYPEIDFALARYHQDTSLDRNCQLAHTFECASICCTYDNPGDNTTPAPTPACTVAGGVGGPVAVLKNSPGDECINYAGNCGPPRRGADVLAGFGSDINRYLSWLDGAETAYDPGQTPGDYCPGGDCELRGTGPTPLANSLQAVEDYLVPIKGCDAAAIGTCRRYGVILLTDGAESCQGDPVAAAAALRAEGIDTYVVGFSVLSTEEDQLDAIAAAGGTGTAFVVGNEDQLANALASIVSGSIVFETCNDLDDDCDGAVDEDFPNKGEGCDDGALGACADTGTLDCTGDGAGLACVIDTMGTGDPGAMELCNGLDDNCNGAVDEGLSCTGCTPTSLVDLCNGLDDDCDGAFEEDDPVVGTACGASDVAPCQQGEFVCIGGGLVCVGAIDPLAELCNGLDDDCDGNADDAAACPVGTTCVEGGCRLPCQPGEFACPVGLTCVADPDGSGDFCVPSPCAACGANEICISDVCVDPCVGVTCGPAESCRFGTCVDCDVLGCPAGQICLESACVADACAGIDCEATCEAPLGCSCYQGTCVANCDDADCAPGEACVPGGGCAVTPCSDVTCAPGQACADGACVADPCAGVNCGPGEACEGGACVDDPCKQVTCGGAFVCEVRDGEPLCVPEAPRPRSEFVTAAGGGCATGGGDGGLAGAMLLLGLALVARRRAA